MGKNQWRLSFSRAEIVLINSWMPVQQIVYHMLRVFMKIELLKDSDVSEALSNYHIKTLMMWACEMKSSSFWTDDLNLIRICVELLRYLSVWLTDAQCQHYFINSCNLIHNTFNVKDIACQLMSVDEAWLSTWFVNSYIRKCSMLCSDNVMSLFSDVSTNIKLQNAVSAVVNYRLNTALIDTWRVFYSAESDIESHVYCYSLTVKSCIYWMSELPKIDKRFPVFFIAVAFLHIAYNISRIGFTDELMDVLATVTGQHPATLRAADLNISKLLELLQRSAVEYLTIFRQLEARDFGSV